MGCSSAAAEREGEDLSTVVAEGHRVGPNRAAQLAGNGGAALWCMRPSTAVKARGGSTWQEVMTLAGPVPLHHRRRRANVARPAGLTEREVDVLRLIARGQQEATQRAAAAIPDARVPTLDGHSHIAHRVDAAMVAAIVREFVSS